MYIEYGIAIVKLFMLVLIPTLIFNLLLEMGKRIVYNIRKGGIKWRNWFSGFYS